MSVKDKKWSYERERRYVLFLYDEYDYTELDRKEDRFLKLKSSLLISPDFILGDNPKKEILRSYNWNKRNALNTKDYIFCSNCFSCEFDLLYDNIDKCPICNSSNIQKIDLQPKIKG